MKKTLSVIVFLFCLGACFAQTNLYEFRYSQYTDDGDQMRTAWVWNTKTGKSARYYYDAGAWKKSSVALPANPLGDNPSEVGEIMMDYSQYTDGGDQMRTVLVWNTKTGKSARYYYDVNTWKKSTAALPSNPLGESSSKVGEIMMDYSQYTDQGDQMRTVLVWNTRTGKSARYYYDVDTWKKSTAAIPANPLD